MKLFKTQISCRILFLAVLLLPVQLAVAGTVISAPETAGFSSEKFKVLSTELQKYIDDNKLSGINSLVVSQGKVVYKKSFGMADIENKKVMTSDALFRIASMTKPITSTAVMMLFEEGKFALDDPISLYIPEFKDPQVLLPNELSKGEESSYTLVAANREITIRDLLTHSSGIIYGFLDVPHLTKIYRDDGISDGLAKNTGTIGDMVRKLAKLPLKHQPGEHFTYGLNTDVLGYFVEVISGQPLDKFLEERIFKPLQMTNTHFYLPEGKKERLAPVYEMLEEGGLRKTGEETIGEGAASYSTSFQYMGPRTYFSGGAGLVSSIDDYSLFLQMLLNKGSLGDAKILDSKTVELMSQNHLQNEGQGENNFRFGLGFMIHNKPKVPFQGATEGSLSWAGFFHTSFWIDPKNDFFAICLTQTFPAKNSDVHRKFESLVSQSLLSNTQTVKAASLN